MINEERRMMEGVTMVKERSEPSSWRMVEAKVE
jgi:hypothetical protein